MWGGGGDLGLPRSPSEVYSLTNPKRLSGSIIRMLGGKLERFFKEGVGGGWGGMEEKVTHENGYLEKKRMRGKKQKKNKGGKQGGGGEDHTLCLQLYTHC